MWSVRYWRPPKYLRCLARPAERKIFSSLFFFVFPTPRWSHVVVEGGLEKGFEVENKRSENLPAWVMMRTEMS